MPSHYDEGMMIEARVAPRVYASLPLRTGCGLAGRTRDLSTSGVFFKIDGCFEPDPTIDFSVELEWGGRPMILRGQGQVLRVETNVGNTGVAVKMTESHFEFNQ
jgi:hypothetical protein